MKGNILVGILYKYTYCFVIDIKWLGDIINCMSYYGKILFYI